MCAKVLNSNEGEDDISSTPFDSLDDLCLKFRRKVINLNHLLKALIRNEALFGRCKKNTEIRDVNDFNLFQLNLPTRREWGRWLNKYLSAHSISLSLSLVSGP